MIRVLIWATSYTGTQQQDNTQIYVMNNYCGIGIDADLCLGFHNAREENPNKFNSRCVYPAVFTVYCGRTTVLSRKKTLQSTRLKTRYGQFRKQIAHN